MDGTPAITDQISSKSTRVRGRPRILDAELLALAAVARLLDTYPVPLITMELVAEHSGVSKVTLYRRWPSRLALLVDAMLERIAATMVLDATQPPAVAIRNHIISMVKEFNGATGTIVRGIIGSCLADPDMSDTLRKHYLGDRRDLAIHIIRRGQEDGSFAATASPEQLHDLLYGALWYRFLFQVGALTRRQALSVVADVLAPTC